MMNFKELQDFVTRQEWKFFIRLLQDEFDDNYKKLRKTKKSKQVSDSKYDEINGYLNGIEKAMTIMNDYIIESQQPDINQAGTEE